MGRHKKPKMTDWFPPEVKPVHVGEYNASRCRAPNALLWWNGHFWSRVYWPNESRETQERRKFARSEDGHIIEWRGLVEKPNEPKPSDDDWRDSDRPPHA